jgi:MFS family permease
LGSEISSFAIPIVAAISLGARPGDMGVLFLGSSATSLAIRLFAGAWVDRVRRRSVLIAADVASAAAIGSIPLAAAFGSLTFGHLFVAYAVLGAVRPFLWSGFTAYIPTLVPSKQLVEANAKLSATESGAAVVGPGIAGTLVEVLTAPFALVVDAISFLVSAVFLRWVRSSEPPAEDAERRRLLDEIREGISVTLRDPVLRWIAILNSLRVVGTLVWPNYVIFALRVLDVSPLTFGLVGSVGAIGFLGGSLLAPRLARRFGIGPTIAGASWLLFMSPFFMPFAPARSALAPTLLTAAAVVGATGDMVMAVTLESYMQAVTPKRLLGRVSATTFFLAGIGFLVGPVIGGFLGEAIGIRATILLSACLHVLWPLCAWGSPLRRLHAMPWQPGERAETLTPQVPEPSSGGPLPPGILPPADSSTAGSPDERSRP